MASRLTRIIASVVKKLRLTKEDTASKEEKKTFVKTLELYSRMFPKAETIEDLKDEVISYTRNLRKIAEKKQREEERRKVGYIA